MTAHRSARRRGLKRLTWGAALTLLGVALGTVWVVSTQQQMHVVWGDDGSGTGNKAVGLSRGVLFVSTLDETPAWALGFATLPIAPGVDWLRPFDGVSPEPSSWFAGYIDTPNAYRLVRVVAWPFPLLALGGGVWLVWSGVRARRRSREGCCVECGYDLRGLAAGAKCPECGAIEARTPP